MKLNGIYLKMTDHIKPFVVTNEEDGQRLDKWINSRFSHVS